MDIREILLKAGVNLANRMIADAREDINQQLKAYMVQYPTWPVANGFDEALVVKGSISEPDLELHPYKNICCGEEFDPRGPVVEPITDKGRLLD